MYTKAGGTTLEGSTWMGDAGKEDEKYGMKEFGRDRGKRVYSARTYIWRDCRLFLSRLPGKGL